MSSYYRLKSTLIGHHGILASGVAYMGQTCALNHSFVMLQTPKGHEMIETKHLTHLPHYSLRVGDDALEQEVPQALDGAGIEYQTDYEGASPQSLDFYLPAYDVHIEVKAAHAARVSDQMARVDNVIVLQGPKAVALFARSLFA